MSASTWDYWFDVGRSLRKIDEAAGTVKSEGEALYWLSLHPTRESVEEWKTLYAE